MNPEEILREYEICRNQSEIYQQNLELVTGSLAELKTVDRGLDEIKDVDKNNEVLVPIGMDSFIKARIIDPKNVIVGIGASVAVKKTVEDAKVDVGKRIAELEKVKAYQTSNLEKLISKLVEL
ncbi:MAG: prefoldin subunit alpha, partial [Candidatus Hydrothermarchaeaceae archaeon]